jgi:hypothetical protein
VTEEMNKPDDQQNFYRRSKTATLVDYLDTKEDAEGDIYDASQRIPFVYVPSRDTLYIGSKDSHHIHVLKAAFPEEDSEYFSIEDDQGNLGVILKDRILYWGEPIDDVIRAMKEKYPELPQYIYDDDEEDDLRKYAGMYIGR